MNKHESTLWGISDPHWTTEKSLNSLKVMVCAAVRATGINGPFFIE